MADPVSRSAMRSAAKRCLEVTEDIVDEIRSNPMTPYRGDGPPTLRESYYATPTGPGAAVRCAVDYWRFVEFGTRYMSAEPHVRPALELVRARNR